MNIALIGPSPVPYAVGGVENLLAGLQFHFNKRADIHCELLKLPSREHDFWSLIDSYERFFRLDVSHFDMVISTKYPAWLVQHPNHVCYVQHRLRGLYDTYSFCGEPTAFESDVPAVKRVLEVICDSRLRGAEGIARAFEALARLREAAPGVPAEVFKFPGPFIRKLLMFLDDRAMADGGVKRFLAISRTVAGRTEYFPEGAAVTVDHHPSFLAAAPAAPAAGGEPYIFTASRLDGPKRVGLLVEAMRHVDRDISLNIAGTGPLEPELRRLAGGDPRIHFLGYTPDERLAELYAGALAVAFVPYQEDYGLITIEAMRAGKPVLTTGDSGGPNEFVVDGQTGYSVAPQPEALAERVRYFADNPGEAQRMGINAREKVAPITWDNTLAALLGTPALCEAAPIERRVARAPREKIVVTSTFGVYPPRGGGQNRLYFLYRALAATFDVEIVSVARTGEPAYRGEIAPYLVETRIPKSRRHAEAEAALEGQLGQPVTDVAMPRLIALSPEYEAALREATASARWIVASHPYLLPAIDAVRGLVPLVYEAHNVEVDLKEPFLGQSKAGRDLLALTRSVEEAACRSAEIVTTCSQEDADRLEALFGGVASKAVVVPNGVDLATVPFVPLAERLARQRACGLGDGLVALFMGAWHPPNLEAANHVLGFAKELPDVAFLLVGSVGAALEGRSLPPNVALAGVVDDGLKAFLLSCADVALNPMVSGSGTNLKMLDYFAAGLPVISTPFGARGLEIADGEHLVLCEIADMPAALRAFQPTVASELAPRARALVEAAYGWDTIASAHCETLRCFSETPLHLPA